MRLLKVKEAANILGISPLTLYQWHWQKKHLPFIKVGRSLRVSEYDLLKFIEDRKDR